MKAKYRLTFNSMSPARRGALAGKLREMGADLDDLGATVEIAAGAESLARMLSSVGAALEYGEQAHAMGIEGENKGRVFFVNAFWHERKPKADCNRILVCCRAGSMEDTRAVSDLLFSEAFKCLDASGTDTGIFETRHNVNQLADMIESRLTAPGTFCLVDIQNWNTRLVTFDPADRKPNPTSFFARKSDPDPKDKRHPMPVGVPNTD